MLRTSIVAVAAGFVFACAAPQHAPSRLAAEGAGAGPGFSAPPRAEAPGPASSTARAEPIQVVCRMERPTGSNIAKRVCWRKDDLERVRQDAQRLMQSRPLPPQDADALARPRTSSGP
jgi:hypothetical protein